MAIIAMTLMTGLGVTTASMVSTQQAGRTTSLASEQAYALAQAGVEFARNRIDQGVSPAMNGLSAGEGSFRIVTVPNTSQLTATGQVGTAQKTFNLNTGFAGSGCVVVTVNDAQVVNDYITGITLEKSCLEKPTIANWIISWQTDALEKVTALTMEGESSQQIYNNPVGTGSGGTIDSVDYALDNAGVDDDDDANDDNLESEDDDGIATLTKVQFNTNLSSGKTYQMTVNFTDGSSVTKCFQHPQNNNGNGNNGNGNGNGGNTTICHLPPGNPANAQTLTVGQSAVNAHLAHGDYTGACSASNEVQEVACGNNGNNNQGQNTTICHHPPGNPNNTQTLSVGQAAVPAHLAHGDSLGACPN